MKIKLKTERVTSEVLTVLAAVAAVEAVSVDTIDGGRGRAVP